MCTDIFRRCGDAIKRKHPEKWKTSTRFLFHDNAPAHRSDFVKAFLAKNNVTTLENHPYSPDLAAANFDLFLPLKSTLKKRLFSDGTNIKNVMEELKKPSQNCFQECFQHI